MIKTSVIEELEAVQFVSIRTDMWTSICGVDYMAITSHFYKESNVGPDIMLAHKCLEVIPFNEVSHTAFNLKNFIIQVLRDWDIEDKVVAVVRDNGRDITAAINMSRFSAVSCTAHTLQ